jgi:hypothetical protein
LSYASALVVTTRPPPVDVALGEFETERGFRRVSRAPEPLALARLRELLLDVASDGSVLLRQGLEGFESWRSLASLCGTEWTAGVRRSSVAARRVLQRRLRVLGAQPIDLTDAAGLPVGSSVHVRGTVVGVAPGRRPIDDTQTAAPRTTRPAHISYITHIGDIWSLSTMNTDNVRLAIEEGHDFFLTDEKGQTACVIATRGVLLNADTLRAGDRISVFGFVDSVVGPRGQTEGPPARRTPSLALRAGDDLPLLLRRLTQERGREGRSTL